MSLNPPFFATTLDPRIPTELELLYQRTRVNVTDDDKMTGIQLLIDALCELIDTCFGQIFDEMGRIHPSKELTEAHAVIEDIKGKARHYIAWVGTFIANKRLPPVIAHYYSMTHPMDLGHGPQLYMAFNVDPAFAAELKQALAKMMDGTLHDIHEVVDLLVRVMDVTLEPLLLKPINLMGFNFVINKTLDGVIGVVRILNRRMLRKLAPSIPRDLYPTVAKHLSQFLFA